MDLSRRDLLRGAAAAAAVLALPGPLRARAWAGITAGDDPDLERLIGWTRTVRRVGEEGVRTPFGRLVAAVGERAVGTAYEAHTAEAYIEAGGDPTGLEPLALSLSGFDCVTLVESCIAVARLARLPGDPVWSEFGREVERLRYRGGVRGSYLTRLHYFSEWIRDNEERGGMWDLGRELGGVADTRPLRFMSGHRALYPALAGDEVFAGIRAMERRLDGHPRYVVPTERIPDVLDRIQTGDILAFATSVDGLDVTHAALAYRTGGSVRVLHAPLSGGRVEVTGTTLPAYVRGIDRAVGILVARPAP